MDYEQEIRTIAAKVMEDSDSIIADFNKKVEDFLKVEVELASHPVALADLGSVKLSPQHLMTLEPILDQPAS